MSENSLEASKVGHAEIGVLVEVVRKALAYKPLGKSPWVCEEAEECFDGIVAVARRDEAAIQALRDWAWNADVESRPAHVVCSCNPVGAMHEMTCPISLWVNLTGQLNGTIRAILGPSPVFHSETTGQPNG